MNNPKQKCVLIDRDGVINFDSPDYIKSPEEWHPIPGSLEAIAQLNRAGYRVFIVSNQSGLSRNYYDLVTLSDIHEKLLNELSAVGGHIDEILFCPHHPDDDCSCRKPKPGMFHDIRDRHHVDLKAVYFIGDSPADFEASIAAGCHFLLVLTGNGEKTAAKYHDILQSAIFKDLEAAVAYILNH